MNRKARVHFETAKNNGFNRQANADMGAIKMVIGQIAAGLIEMSSKEDARTHLSNAINNCVLSNDYSLRGILLVLQQVAAGMEREVS